MITQRFSLELASFTLMGLHNNNKNNTLKQLILPSCYAQGVAQGR